MKIVQITPGAGGMYCGNCFRDNALVRALRAKGNETLMVPLYLPMTLDEEDQSAGVPVFFGGINVYLAQRSAFFRSTPRWLKNLLDRPALLRWASGRAAKTRAADVGDLTVSMLRGEKGHQARELEELIAWLKPSGRPDVISLSNALLCGLVRRLKQAFRTPVVCFLQGEDSFLDGLPESYRAVAWETLARRADEVDLFIAPSAYFGELMRNRLRLPAEKIRIIHNGIGLDGFVPAAAPPVERVVGYFARMCPEKGLDTLVEAFIRLRKEQEFGDVRLRVGGSCGPADHSFVYRLQQRLDAEALGGEVEFLPNLDRGAKQEFYRSLTVFSVPARYGEAFGLYLVEALACGVPVVQPRAAAFPELLEMSGGGLLCEPEDAASLAAELARVLRDRELCVGLGRAGRRAAEAEFSVEQMADKVLEVYQGLVRAGLPVRRRGEAESE